MGLALFDKNGKTRAGLTILDEPLLTIYDDAEKQRVVLQLLDDGDPKLTLIDKYRANRAVLGLFKGQPAIAFTDVTGKVIWGAPK
jgi:hypothetical protein